MYIINIISIYIYLFKPDILISFLTQACQISDRYKKIGIFVLHIMKKYRTKSFRISEELNTKLCAFSKQKTLSYSKVIKKAIHKFLEEKK